MGDNFFTRPETLEAAFLRPYFAFVLSFGGEHTVFLGLKYVYICCLKYDLTSTDEACYITETTDRCFAKVKN